MPFGVTVFYTLHDALAAGFEVYDKYVDAGEHIGYLVRTNTGRGWAQAIVDLRKEVKVFEFSFGQMPYLPNQHIIATSHSEAHELLEQESYPIDLIEGSWTRELSAYELIGYRKRGSNSPEFLDLAA